MNKIITNKWGWLFCLILFLGLHVDGYSQHRVSGTVTDESSETIPGVNVRVQGTTTGTTTGANGNYELTVESVSDTLIFSFVGYQSQIVPVNGRSQINVTLRQQTFSGEELVVVGYGTQREEDVTSAVSSVESDEFLQASPKDAASLIKGKVAGLIVSEPSGDPTAGTEISLRGTTSINAPTDPLVLIDGIPGELNTVPAENIESIDVLKDGSAAAIYGSRGSNGVILITTKTHSGGQSTSIRYDGYVNYQTIKNQPNFLDAEDYRKYIDQGYGFTDLGYNTDWQDQVLRNPLSQTHNLSFSGGNSKTNYTASINYENSEGIFLRTDDEEYTARVNVGHTMFDGKIVADLNLIMSDRNHYNGFSGYIWRQSLIRNPTDRIRNDEGKWQERGAYRYDNPLGLIHETNGEDESRNLRINGTLAWNPLENLSFKIMGSSNSWNGLSGRAETFDHVSTVKSGLNGVASRNTWAGSDRIFEFTGNYDKSIAGHEFNLLGGYSYQQVINEGFYAGNRYFPTDAFGYNSLESGSGLNEGVASMSSYKNSHKLIGFFSRLNYSWDNRFMLMGSVRYEGNSKFGADHKWGLFPAVSAGWRITEESFMENVDLFDNLKLRAGFGVTGIAPREAYQSLASYSYGGRFLYNGEWVQGIQPSRNPNPDLRWERKEEINIGLDFSMLNDRLSGSIDVYQRDTKDMLWNYSVPSPPYLYGSILANVGQMRNQGIEAQLSYDVITRKDANWSTSVNYSTNRNKLVTLSNEIYKTSNDYFDAGYTGEPIQLSTHRVEIGGPIGNFYGYESVDIDENGEWIVLNKEGNRIPIAQVNEDDRRYLGNGIPNHYLSWNNSFKYKNFDMSVNIRGAFDYQILNFQRMFYENPTILQYNMLESAFHDVYGKRELNYDLAYTSYYIEDGDYVKIDNITLGYTFGLENMDLISNARVYLSGRNLFTFTGYKGMDPEVSTSGMAPGNDPRDKYPTTRTFTLGVNLTF